MTWTNGHAHHLTPFRATCVPCDHQSFHMRRSFQLNSSFNNHFPGEYQNNYLHNCNISLNGQETGHLEQARYMINNVNLLIIVMADQAIIQAALSSVKTFDGDIYKFEAWITSVENAAQISGQDILWIAFPKMIGSPLTSAHILRDKSPNFAWENLKVSCLGSILQFPLTIMQARLSHINYKAHMNCAKCIYTVPLRSYWKSTTLQTCHRFQQRAWTITLLCIAWTPES